MIVYPPVERYVLICRKCQWCGTDDRALTIPYRQPSGTLQSAGCPNCRRWNVLYRKCDEFLCRFEASHMKEVPGGFRLTCFNHIPTNVIIPKSLKYRRKPLPVEAFQMTRERRASNADWPQWLHKAWNGDPETIGSVYPTEMGTSEGTLSIRTSDGPIVVSWDDWIIREGDGEIYSCKPAIFKKTYVEEPVP